MIVEKETPPTGSGQEQVSLKLRSVDLNLLTVFDAVM